MLAGLGHFLIVVVGVFVAGTIVTLIFAWRMLVLSDRARQRDRATEMRSRVLHLVAP